MATTRIKDLAESLTLESDMYIAVDNEEATKKVLAANLIDDSLTESGKFADAGAIGDALGGKVEKIAGKGLSTNDYTTAEKQKLAGIEVEANKTLIDTTLEEEGQAADAKATGDALNDLKEDYSKNVVEPFNDKINLFDGKDIVYGGWSGSSLTLDSTKAKRTAVIKCKPNTKYWLVRDTIYADRFGRVGTTTEYPKDGSTVTQLADIGGLAAWSVTTGANAQYLLFYYTYTGLDEFVQITDYEKTTLNQSTYPILSDSVYTKKEINALIPQAETKKCKIKKTNDVIDIYMPSKSSSNYIHFAYMLVNDSTKNFNQWKVMDTDVCDAELNVLFNLYASSNDVEWEGVVKETGAVDFIGGFHGDEVNTMLSVMIDGKPLDLTENLAITDCDEVLIVNKSTVNSCDTPSNQLFTRYKVSRWAKEKYTVRNRWIALKNSISLQLVYMTMFSLPITKGNYKIATSGRYDDGYIVQSPTGEAITGSCLYNSNYAKTVEFWGDDFYGRATAIYDNYDDYICVCDRSQSNIFKGYWRQHVSGVTLNTNDELNGLSEYEFFC